MVDRKAWTRTVHSSRVGLHLGDDRRPVVAQDGERFLDQRQDTGVEKSDNDDRSAHTTVTRPCGAVAAAFLSVVGQMFMKFL
jgi:hypothetical protein